jgi:HEAT repeat protein
MNAGGRWVAATAAACLLALPAAADLDLGVPMGTPLDWEQELHQPIPTGLSPGRDPKAAAPTPGDQGTIVQGPKVKPPAMGFTSVNLYNFLRVKTHDIMTHFTVKIPMRTGRPVGVPEDPPTFRTGDAAGGAVSKKDRPQSLESGILSNYTPPVPGELAWIGIANCLRTILHPELVCTPEVIAYLVEIGDPSLVGADSVTTNIAGPLKALIRTIPETTPAPPTLSTPFDNMLAKVATLELVNGYPHALDPTYARRTLMMGDQAYAAVLKCADSPHPFLQQNAVVVLANFGNPDSGKELARIFGATQDNTVKARCIAGLARRKDKAQIPFLLGLAKSRDDWIRALAIYALGHIATGDKKVSAELLALARQDNSDLRWSALPALARIADSSPQVSKGLSEIYRQCWDAAKGIPHPIPPGERPNDFRAPNPEPAGYKKRIIADFAQIAAAVCGDASARQELIAKLNGGGIQAFTEASYLLLAESLPLMGDQGQEAAKKLARHNDVVVAMSAMKSLANASPCDTAWVKQFVMSGGNALVRAAGLTVLFRHTQGDIREACHHVVKGYGGGGAEEAYLVGMAIQMLDRLADNKADELISVVQKAKGANHIARRVATDEYDITKAKIDVSPPLLEIATLSLSRTGDPAAIPVLLELLTGSPACSEAALALSGMPLEGESYAKVIGALIDALGDPKNGWLRFCAYQALKNITKEDYFVDYIFGSAGSVYGAQDRYRAWLKKKLEGK